MLYSSHLKKLLQLYKVDTGMNAEPYMKGDYVILETNFWVWLMHKIEHDEKE
jgi:hypothetical protein